MANDIQTLLENAIQSLINDGKEPTTALIKSRLSQPVPMPVIISALQSWKRTKKVPGYTQIQPEQTLEQRVAALEEQVKNLTEQLNQLASNK
ncbi:hypothetical protein [Thaumasiovibrio subtropicus]|uniref:hypothetical protein n=1 Tax=Thaumasiovibrio subtropicus TaxID=1891207 RepID=UPI000B35F2CA|nr:hypothetical protein [Thaumasiovibrio subtropicus]